MLSLRPLSFIVLAQILLLGCAVDRQVLDTSDQSAAPDDAPGDSESDEVESVPLNAAVEPHDEPEEEEQEEAEEEMPTFVTLGPLTDRPECDDEATVLFDELDEVYDLGITDAHVYSATYLGLLRGALDGSESEMLVERYMQRIWTDEEHVYFSTGSGEISVLDMDGESVLLPTRTAVEGVSQDETAIFAISEGYLVRVDKATKEVTSLVEHDVDVPLHWSGTAVDDEHVYFASYYGNEIEANLERIRKDGTDREQIASAITDVMRPVSLLVDEHHVYIVSDAHIARVEVTGGSVTPIATPLDILGILAAAQDEACLYYSTADSVVCYSKTNGTYQRVLDHRASALATHSGDLYVGVSTTGPAFAPNGFVGRVGCAQ